MKPTIKIDFVSDIACPWCAVGYGHLALSMASMIDQVDFLVHYRAFQLNPQMPLGGQDAMEHLTQKYGLSLTQVQTNQAQIRVRAKEAGFDFHPEGRKRVYNTFQCHRLLYWVANEIGLVQQASLKKELLNTYFCLAVSIDDVNNVLEAVSRAGLDTIRADQILKSDEFTEEVKTEENFYKNLGIHSVPSMIVNDQYLLQGAQDHQSLTRSFQKILEEASS